MCERQGVVPPPRKFLAFSPSKWCILMHSGARFRRTRPITAFLSYTCSKFPQKGIPRNFCVDFSGGFNPCNPPLNTGLVPGSTRACVLLARYHLNQYTEFQCQSRTRVGSIRGSGRVGSGHGSDLIILQQIFADYFSLFVFLLLSLYSCTAVVCSSYGG